MKKWKILIPSLVATASMPLIGLVGCENKKTIKPHVYFNNGGYGKLEGDLDIEVEKGTRWCDLVNDQKLPEAEGIKGYTFAGWFRQGSATPLSDTDQTVIKSNWSVTAQFTAPTTPMVCNGSSTLVSPVGRAGADQKLWQLKLGDQTLSPVTWSLVGAPTGVTISNSGQISWPATLAEDSYPFIVHATYNGSQYDSDPVYLHIGPTTTTFQEDSWDVVCWWANAGLDALHSVYAADCHMNNFNPDTFVGLERKINLNGQEHKVVVVDENADTYTENEKQVPAALTFQFQNLISCGESWSTAVAGSALCISWESTQTKGSGDYWHSDLENALNGTNSAEPVLWEDINEGQVGEVGQISVYKMIQNAEPNLALNIKLVNRTVCTYDSMIGDYPVWEPTSQATRLFCPTFSNYFSTLGVENTDDSLISDISKVILLFEGQSYAENKQYAYYENDDRISDNPLNQTTYDFLALKDTVGTGGQGSWFYWTGSPYLDFPDQIADISPLGCMQNYGNITDINPIAPCFCI